MAPLSPSANAKEAVVVNSIDELREAIKETSPGSVIELADGVYDLQRDLELKRQIGTSAAPITIRAQHLLKAEFSGNHIVKLRDSEYLVLEGFRFTLKADVHGKGGALSVRNCHHCRITRNDFELAEQDTGDKNQTWLTLDGLKSGHNLIDRNRFSNKKKPGHFIFVTGEDEYVSQQDIIERNHFANRAYGNDSNGFETIRVGESRIGNAGGKSSTTIRDNLFEKCQGEDEMISFKVGGGSFTGNTILNCHGSVVFRNGNDGVFANNMILNTYAKRPFEAYRSGGIRFYGSGHRVFNNYFEGLDGTSMKAPLALMHGAPAGSGSLGVADGLPAVDCQVVHNTWVRCAQLRIGMSSKKRPLKPQDCIFSNNLVSETNDDRLLELYEAEGVQFRGNILHATNGKETGVEGMTDKQAFQIADPKLNRTGKVMRLAPGSPAIDNAWSAFLYVHEDMNGQPRDDKPDVGADEYSPGSSVERNPLTPDEVGPHTVE
ncbi:polysaccharide lyase 6 family protein [Adhaeretor mobilis]|uniref:Chondroitinase-B n=1 Tax=Adhaeretor mobilis TaxID=1930276 RepID=A0A517MYS8_9BACT|nr:polysaccharide lyase 6 family protein [Adhaeretor mobilis]QDS99967.1 Chondroitinase-B precursor [Adhaeretor mobilis]